MEATDQFRTELGEALEAKRAALEQRQIPKLKEEYRLFHSAFHGIYQVLYKKGVLAEDPYKHVEKISDISPPSSEHILDSERDQQMGIRLGQYDNQLDYLNNYTQFDLESLTLKRLKNIVDLTNYIRWPQLSPNSTHPPTRNVAEYVSKLKGEADKISVSVVKDSQEQLSNRSKTIMRILKEISTFKKYEYKHRVLQDAVPQAGLAEEESVEQSVKKLRRAFSAHKLDIPFYADLVGELVEELRDQAKRENAMASLQVEEEQAPKKKEERKLKPIVLEALRTLAGASRPIESATTKLQENVTLLESRRRGLFQKLRELIDRLYNRKTSGRVFELEYLDEQTSTGHSERLDFDEFTERATQKSRLCAAMLSRASNLSRKLEAAKEEQLFEYLNKQLFELYTLRRQIQSLDTYLQSEVPREKRPRLRGVNVELQSIKDAISKANQKKHHYVAGKEEQEQFKKLGIQPD